VDSQAEAYARLEDAYRAAYAKADGLDDLNQALVRHYIARSSRAVANFLRTRSGDLALAGKAGSFAASAADQDTLSAAQRFGKYLYKLLPAGALGAIALGAVTFFLTVLSDFNQGGQQVGAQVAGLVVSGGMVAIFARAAYLVFTGATAAGRFVVEALQDAASSNREPKRVLAELAGPEAAVFGPAAVPLQANVGRAVVHASGPLLATVLALVIAVPVALAASALAGAVSGFQNAPQYSPLDDLPPVTTPSESETYFP
jgi:hypothetical protein